MALRRVMGIETEYGISSPTEPGANPMLLSSQIVNVYAAQGGSQPGSRAERPRWDYEDEAPLRDARGFEVPRAAAHPSQLTDRPDVAASGPPGGAGPGGDIDDPSLANVILTNGARLYVDHAHPEYSSPEVTTPLDAVLWDKAGEQVMAAAVARVAATPGLAPISLYKNNTDNKGASYGCHENYLMSRATPFSDIVAGLTPFLVTRQVFTGAGRVSLGADGSRPGFQVSQRADFIEVEVGLETTLKRPIVNTRDEPHASADRYRRLHVIIGDANLVEPATFLKIGTTALVLDMIEDHALDDVPGLAEPVAALHAISHDPTLQEKVRTRDGATATALDVQWTYLEAAQRYVASRDGGDAEAQVVEVLRRWEDVLTRLQRDPMECHRDVEWVAKYRLLRQYADREGLGWEHPKLQAIDLQWSDVRPDKGLYHRLAARGAVDRLLTDDDATAADTRAYFRGECLRRYGADVAAASWDSVIFDIPGRGALQRVPTLDPLRGTRDHVGSLLDRCDTAADLVRELSGAR
jgi:proteasome accessory factor A